MYGDTHAMIGPFSGTFSPPMTWTSLKNETTAHPAIRRMTRWMILASAMACNVKRGGGWRQRCERRWAEVRTSLLRVWSLAKAMPARGGTVSADGLDLGGGKAVPLSRDAEVRPPRGTLMPSSEPNRLTRPDWAGQRPLHSRSPPCTPSTPE